MACTEVKGDDKVKFKTEIQIKAPEGITTDIDPIDPFNVSNEDPFAISDDDSIDENNTAGELTGIKAEVKGIKIETTRKEVTKIDCDDPFDSDDNYHEGPFYNGDISPFDSNDDDPVSRNIIYDELLGRSKVEVKEIKHKITKKDVMGIYPNDAFNSDDYKDPSNSGGDNPFSVSNSDSTRDVDFEDKLVHKNSQSIRNNSGPIELSNNAGIESNTVRGSKI